MADTKTDDRPLPLDGNAIGAIGSRSVTDQDGEAGDTSAEALEAARERHAESAL